MLDHKLLALPPIVNEVVAVRFQSLPFYFNHHQVLPQKKRLHTQPGVEVNLTHTGSGYFVVEGKCYRQQPGSLMIIPGNLAHQIYAEAGSSYRRTVLCLDQQRLGWTHLGKVDWIANACCISSLLPTDVYLPLKHICTEIETELRNKQNGWENMIIAQLLALSVTIQRSLDQQTQQDSPASIALITYCCSYIEDHIHEDLSLIRMAGQVAVSPEHLTRLFKRSTGLSYYQYVIAQRLYAGKRLLAQYPHMSITEVAYQTGFSSSSHFSRQFKKLTGMTASRYQDLTHLSIKDRQDDHHC